MLQAAIYVLTRPLWELCRVFDAASEVVWEPFLVEDGDT
jgi:hypothetical protein